MRNLYKILLVVVGLIIVFVMPMYYGDILFAQYGVIKGKVTIGPFCPVEPPSGCPPPPGTYSSRQIILQPSFGNKILIPLNETGYFEARLKVGTYEVNLTNCTFLGCGRALPVTVIIKKNQVSELNIEIDTGIR